MIDNNEDLSINYHDLTIEPVPAEQLSQIQENQSD